SQHIAGNITTVHIQPRSQKRDDQAARAASRIQRGLSVVLDLLLEIGDFGPGGIVLGPVSRHHAVMPGLHRTVHAADLRLTFTSYVVCETYSANVSLKPRTHEVVSVLSQKRKEFRTILRSAGACLGEAPHRRGSLRCSLCGGTADDGTR